MVLKYLKDYRIDFGKYFNFSVILLYLVRHNRYRDKKSKWKSGTNPFGTNFIGWRSGCLTAVMRPLMWHRKCGPGCGNEERRFQN
jgi:hypothetical protein